MSAHLNDGELRAAIDGELAPAGCQHLQDCRACQGRLAELRSTAQRVSQRLSFLNAPQGGRLDPRLEPRGELARFKIRYNDQKEIPMFKKLFNRSTRAAWAGLGVILVLAVALSIPSVQVFAGEFLGMFRIKQVTVLPVDTSGLNTLTGNSTIGKQLSQLLSASVTVDQKGGEPQKAADAQAASQMAGFTVRLPAGESPSALYVSGATAFHMVVDRARAQSILDEAGHSDLKLPAELDGATISVSIPSGVSAGYGACPDLAAAQQAGPGPRGGGSMGRRYPDCLMLVEIPSPTVSTPPNVDLGKLAEVGLQFTGMTAEQAHEFSQKVDWTSSLVVPIPRNAATYQDVQVDGVQGKLIQRPADDMPEFALMWVKDGIIYTIGGLGSDSAKALSLANSLP